MADYSHDDLTGKLDQPGWQRTTPAGDRQTGTLKDVTVSAHTDRAKHPGVVKEIETAVELELIQLQKLWEYLGLPN